MASAAIVYGVLATVCALLLGTMAYAIYTEGKGDNSDKAMMAVVLTVAFICVLAALDWFNLIPEM